MILSKEVGAITHFTWVKPDGKHVPIGHVQTATLEEDFRQRRQEETLSAGFHAIQSFNPAKSRAQKRGKARR